MVIGVGRRRKRGIEGTCARVKEETVSLTGCVIVSERERERERERESECG